MGAGEMILDFNQICQIAKKHFSRAKGSHDWEHTQRVLALAEHIAHKEGASLVVVRCAAVLHDIARIEEDRMGGRVDHALLGARKAERILASLGADSEFVRQVSHCIAAHRFRNSVMPRSLEAKVLFDADKLDSMGAVGIGRAFLFAGEIGAKLHNPEVDPEKTRAYTQEDTAYREYCVKLRHIQKRILTTEGKRLGRARHQYMTGFFKRLNYEVKGKI
jgi:uncharacterized protein